MFLGIDLGTSGLKAVLMSEGGNIIDSQTEALSVSRPQPLWSEQNPEHWWQACGDAVKGLGQRQSLAGVQAIGLSGQMHGATLLDKAGKPLRPAILWNDGRSADQCHALETSVPGIRQLCGNIVMPGFTAPKVLWVKDNEPETFSRINKVLLPKDYLRFCMTGDFATDMSDAAGTVWLDVAGRRWSPEVLSATGLTEEHMPKLFEGCEITGELSAEIAAQWGLGQVPVVAGGGDNAAGAVGVGIVNAGQAMLSLGTSGVYFAVSDGFLCNPESALHSFCHALPDTWHLMSVMLSAASCLDWAAKLTGTPNVSELLKEAETKEKGALGQSKPCWFLPYLSGERTPHNDPHAKGVLFGLSASTDRAEIAQAVLEGVGFGLADGLDALHATGLVPDEITLIGGGARSPFWRQMLADIFGRAVNYREGGDVGPALGAARLAQLATCKGASVKDICPVPTLVQTYEPQSVHCNYYSERREVFTQLYGQLSHLFS